MLTCLWRNRNSFIVDGNEKFYSKFGRLPRPAQSGQGWRMGAVKLKEKVNIK